jgi:hypothetical protein
MTYTASFSPYKLSFYLFLLCNNLVESSLVLSVAEFTWYSSPYTLLSIVLQNVELQNVKSIKGRITELQKLQNVGNYRNSKYKTSKTTGCRTTKHRKYKMSHSYGGGGRSKVGCGPITVDLCQAALTV